MLCGVGLNGRHRATTEYSITLGRSLGPSDAPVRRRLHALHAVYSLLIRLSEQHGRTGDGDGSDSESQTRLRKADAGTDPTGGQ